MHEIPVIDISQLITGKKNESESLVNEIKTAFESVGAFYIKGHGIPVEKTTAILQQARDLLNLPLEKKNALSFKVSKAFRGYFHKGAEKTAGKADYKEGFLFGTEGEDTDGNSMLGSNRFPDDQDVPDFKPLVNTFLDSLSELGMTFAKMFACGLGLKDDFIQTAFSPPFYNMTIWHYPPSPNINDSWGIGPHTDYEAFTFLLQDNVGGLELRTRDGSWIDLPPVEGSLVVMIGDVTECWTKGLFRAPVHRVKNTKSVSRYTVAFFFQPNLKTVVKPLDIPSLKDREYQPTRHGLTIPFTYGHQLKKNYEKYVS